MKRFGFASRVGTRVETKMHFSIFVKMRKSSENGTIFAKFREILFREPKILRKFRENFRKNGNFRENEKSIKFDSDTCGEIFVFDISAHCRRIKKHV